MNYAVHPISLPTTCRRMIAMNGEKSSGEFLGSKFLRGASIGSVICPRMAEKGSLPMGDMNDIRDRATMPNVSAQSKRLMKEVSSSYTLST